MRVKHRLETLAPRSLAHRREERTRPGVLTRVARPFGAPSIGFPGENLLEPNAGAVGRTSAADPFKYVLRCCGPQRAGDLVLRAEVERTGERNAESRIAFGGSSLKEIVLSSRVAPQATVIRPPRSGRRRCSLVSDAGACTAVPSIAPVAYARTAPHAAPSDDRSDPPLSQKRLLTPLA